MRRRRSAAVWHRKGWRPDPVSLWFFVGAGGERDRGPNRVIPSLAGECEIQFRHEGNTLNARKLPDGADAAVGARVDQAHEIVASECNLKREVERHVINEGSRKPEWNIDRNRPSGRTVHVGRRVEG